MESITEIRYKSLLV